jgi:cation:H+ antiporter
VFDLEEKRLHFKKPKLELLWNFIFLAGGLGLIIYASKTVVMAGTNLAQIWGISQSVIGILLIGSLGSSLPELVVSIQALRKKSTGLLLGNLFGSSICTILFPMGIAAVISELKFDISFIYFEIPAIIFATMLGLFFLKTKHRLSSWEAAILILFFVLYVVIKIVTIYLV